MLKSVKNVNAYTLFCSSVYFQEFLKCAGRARKIKKIESSYVRGIRSTSERATPRDLRQGNTDPKKRRGVARKWTPIGNFVVSYATSVRGC